MTLETILTQQLMQIGTNIVGTLAWMLPLVLVVVIVLMGVWDFIAADSKGKYHGRR